MTVAELIEKLRRAPQDKIVRVHDIKGRVGEAELVTWINADGPNCEPGVRIEVGIGPDPYGEQPKVKEWGESVQLTGESIEVARELIDSALSRGRAECRLPTQFT